MKPWVFTDKSKMSSFRSGTNSASVGALALGLCRPYGAQKNVYQCLTQGLRPGLGRSVALAGLFYVFTSNQLLCCFDAVTLGFYHRNACVFCVFELSEFCLHLKPKFEERQVMFMAAFPILETSAKSVQTTAEVCADYTCSLYRLQLKSPKSTTYLQI